MLRKERCWSRVDQKLRVVTVHDVGANAQKGKAETGASDPR